MQRIAPSGAVWPGWPVDGLLVCDAPGTRYVPQLCADGADGAIVVWTDYRAGNPDIYAQRISSAGAVSPGWPADGLPVCADSANQADPAIWPDGAGGAVVSWTDWRNLGSDIFAQRIVSGAALWTDNGVPVCTYSGNQGKSQVAMCGNADTIMVVWNDLRSGWYAPYAQELLLDGSVLVGWPENGIGINSTINYGVAGISLAPDGIGGAYVAWSSCYDNVGSQYDVLCQRLTPSGQPAAGWPPGGRLVSGEQDNQINPRLLLLDENLVAAWEDHRGSDLDIYAAAVTPSGVVPTRLALVRVVVDATGVHLLWQGSAYSGRTLYLFRAVNSNAPVLAAELDVAANGLVGFDDSNAEEGTVIHYSLYDTRERSEDPLDTLIVAIPGEAPVSKPALAPNPTSGTVRLRLPAQSAGPVFAEYFDPRGRHLGRERVYADRGGGATLHGLDGLPSGSYLVRVVRPDTSYIQKVIVLR